MEQYEADLILDLGAELGEGPTWDADGERLMMVEINRNKVHFVIPGASLDKVETIDVGEPVGAVAPRESGGFVAAAESGFVLYGADGEVELRVPVEEDKPSNRLNDAKCDPRGRLWAGSVARQMQPDAALYRFDPDHSVHRILDGITVSNGLDWSPDESTFYYVDTVVRGIDAFDFDVERGTISNRRRFADLPAEYGAAPDGLAVDSEGCVWVAGPLGGTVLRFSPEGELIGRVELPVTQVTSCGFGSPGGADLFITTSAEDYSPAFAESVGISAAELEEMSAEAHRGALFRVTPEVPGLVPKPFAG